MSNELSPYQERQQLATPAQSNDWMSLMQFAEFVCRAGLLPQHLREKPADCLLVAMQAQRWRMDFFAVAQCTSIVRGRPMYEGKLVAAAINSSGALKSALNHRFDGEGRDLTITITGFLKGEDAPREWTVTWAEGIAHAQDKAQWNASPRKRLLYFATREWARVHMPEVMLGVQADDETMPTAPAQSSGPRMPTAGSFLAQQQVSTPGVVENPALGDAGAAQPSDGAHTVMEAEAATPVIPWSQLLGGKWKSAKITQGPDTGCIIADLPATKVAAMRQDGWLKESQPALWEALMASLYESIIAALKKADKTPADFEQYLKDAGAFGETNTLLALSSDDLPDMAEHVKRFLIPAA